MVSAAVGLPPCCAGCPEYDGVDGVCRLVADPTAENRLRLLTMPCAVQRRIEQRFRGYRPEVAQRALAAWLDPAWDADDISLSYGKAPRDARLWIGAWPYVYLGRDAVRRPPRESERPRAAPPADPDEENVETRPLDPALALRVTRALEKVRRIDAVGYAVLLDSLRDRFDAAAWEDALGREPGSQIGLEDLAIHRHAAHFHEIVEGLVLDPQRDARDPARVTWLALRRRLVAPLGVRAGSEHPDPALIIAHASGDLSPEYGLALTRHLAVCDDGRCAGMLRPVVAGAAAAREDLYGERERTFECPDALWEEISAIAREDGCSLDGLLDEAMTAYAASAGRHALSS
jgi:hypothetical protein